MFVYSESIRKEYSTLFQMLRIRPERLPEVNSVINTLVIPNEPRYDSVTNRTGVPWFMVAVIEVLETGGNFNAHLHNGDPLTDRTVHVPVGRPKVGVPPFTWEDSATDAMTMYGWATWTDWSAAGCLYLLESYNGFGYRNLNVLSPYLWSFSTYYTSGKYASDGVYDPKEVSEQCGGAVLIRRMAELGIINIASSTPPFVVSMLDPYADVRFNDTDMKRVYTMQMILNEAPGVWLNVDGMAGPRTAAAYHSITGKWLVGDPMKPTVQEDKQPCS